MFCVFARETYCKGREHVSNGLIQTWVSDFMNLRWVGPWGCTSTNHTWITWKFDFEWTQVKQAATSLYCQYALFKKKTITVKIRRFFLRPICFTYPIYHVVSFIRCLYVVQTYLNELNFFAADLFPWCTFCHDFLSWPINIKSNYPWNYVSVSQGHRHI